LETIVAITASLRRVFAEVTEQDRAPAAGRLHQRRQRVEPLALGGTAIRFHLLLNPLAGAGKVLRGPEQPGLGRFAVSARAAGLLVISLDALGNRGMRDQPYVGFVDAHAE